MSCQRYEENLVLSEAGELSFWRSWALKRHLRRCAPCRRRKVALAKTIDAYATTIHPERRRPRSPRLVPAWPTILLALAILGLTGMGAFLALSRSAPQRVSQPCKPGLPSDACQ